VQLSANRKRLYFGIAIGFIIWSAFYIFLVTELVPTTIYWISYYVADYDNGFVRRGLAGEVLDAIPRSDYFAAARTLVWASIIVYFSALGALAWHMFFRGNGSERRIVVALLIPVLPFSVSYALLGPRPELFAASALLALGMSLLHVKTARSTVVCCTLYGAVIGALAFVHEGIPLEFALGGVLAVLVLARAVTGWLQRFCLISVVGPGLFATGLICIFGRRDVAANLCAQVPHGAMKNTFAVPSGKFWDYVLQRFHSDSDYHDWACQHIVRRFDEGVATALHTVAHSGFAVLTAGFVHGMLVCLGVLWLIGYFTGVSFKEFIRAIRGGLLLPIMAVALFVPVFATGVDWIRWWTVILINIASIYLIFAVDRPELEKPVPAKQVKIFAVVVLVLACVPVAGIAGYSTGFAGTG
jgi:hypothetical protein